MSSNVKIRLNLSLFIMAIICAVNLAASAEEKPLCAVLSFEEGKDVPSGEAAVICDKFTALLTQADRFKLMSRDQVSLILIANKFNRSSYSSLKEAAITAGLMIKADYIICGSIGLVDGRYELSTWLIDSKKSEVVKVVKSRSVEVQKIEEYAPMQNLKDLLGAEELPVESIVKRHEAKVEKVKPAEKSKSVVFGATGKYLKNKMPSKAEVAWMDSAGISWAFVQNREMKRSGDVPMEERFQHFRVASVRYLVNGSWKFSDAYKLSATMGMADLLLHCSEGESTEFAPALAYGMSFDGLICKIPDSDFTFNGSFGLLRFSPADECTTRCRRDKSSTGGDLSLDWIEYEASLYFAFPGVNPKINAGINYLIADNDQSRKYADGTSYSGSYEMKDPLGLFYSVDYGLMENLRLLFDVNIINEFAFGLSAKYLF